MSVNEAEFYLSLPLRCSTHYFKKWSRLERLDCDKHSSLLQIFVNYGRKKYNNVGQTPYAILKVPEDATTRDVIKQAVAKAGVAGKSEHDYVLLEEVSV
jgi:hypothetical protein